MKKVVFIFTLLLSSSAFTQVGISVGANGLLAFGNPKPYGGLHLGLEVPRNERMSYFGRITHFIRQKGKDSVLQTASAINPAVTSPNALTVKGIGTYNYTVIEGGTMFYIGNGFDYGFSGYGSTGVAGIFSQVKTVFDDFDDSKYRIESPNKGMIFSLAVALRGGVKYSFPRFGTLYFEANLKYLAISIASQEGISAPQYKPLLFGIALGYRKDILW